MPLHVIAGDRSLEQSRSPASPGHPLRGTALRQVGLLEFDDGSAVVFQAVDYPRLTHMMRSWVGDRPSEAIWLVDGQPAVDADDAIRLLNEPPKLTDGELEVLRQVPRDWTLPAELKRAVTRDLPQAGAHERIRALGALANKGLLEIAGSRIRQRPEAVFRS